MVTLDCALILNSTLLEQLADKTKAGKVKWGFVRKGYIHKSDTFGFSFDVEQDGLITVILYVVGGGTRMELYTPYDKDWVVANKLKDAIIASFNKSAA